VPEKRTAAEAARAILLNMSIRPFRKKLVDLVLHHPVKNAVTILQHDTNETFMVTNM
jgi:hypothetical protein